MKKTLSKYTMYNYKLSKKLKWYIKSNKIWFFAYHIDKNDFDILKDIQFDNCIVYKYKEYYENIDKYITSYYINFINKRIYKDFYSLNKDFWKLRYSYYFYKLKDFSIEKRYYEYNNYYIENTK